MAGPHDDVHPVALRDAAKFGHVVLALKVEHALALLVDVPKHVEA